MNDTTRHSTVPQAGAPMAAAQSLVGKVAVVTGGGQGLGAAICRSLAEAGAKVIVADIRVQRAQAVCEEMASRGGESAAMELDVASDGDVRRVLTDVAARYGSLDVLINNAAIDFTLPIE